MRDCQRIKGMLFRRL